MQTATLKALKVHNNCFLLLIAEHDLSAAVLTCSASARFLLQSRTLVRARPPFNQFAGCGGNNTISGEKDCGRRTKSAGAERLSEEQR